MICVSLKYLRRKAAVMQDIYILECAPSGVKRNANSSGSLFHPEEPEHTREDPNEAFWLLVFQSCLCFLITVLMFLQPGLLTMDIVL